MKKIIGGLFLVAIMGVYFVINISYSTEQNQYFAKVSNTAAVKFKQEYESLNNVLDDEGNYQYLNIEIEGYNKIKYSSFDEIMELLENGTGIIYFGRPNCPWSRNAVPLLLEAANESDIESIHYFNASSIRDEKFLDENGNIITSKEGTEEYYTLLDKLKPIVKTYQGLNDESIKRLYFPTIVFVKNGEIVDYHTGTVESQNDPAILLNDNQKEELKQIYRAGIDKISDEVCDLNIKNCEK